ncbi:MAG: metallophosphoesterase [Limisphaerales bacterium]
MSNRQTIVVVSDIHYASDAEKQRPRAELAAIDNPALRLLVRGYRHCFWLRDPYAHNPLLDRFLAATPAADLVVANGDYSCDSAFIGVSDDAAFASARECLGKLRQKFGERFHATIGDHELGKMSLFGGRGGLRLASWQRAREELGLQPAWQRECGRYRLIGVTSTLLALPVYEPEALPEERDQWFALRAAHLDEVRRAFDAVRGDERILLFCHDPTALPFLWREEAVRRKLPQVEHTFIGHLHSPLLLWNSRVLSGMPPIRFLGNSIRRMSVALHEARHWRPFNVVLCPALAGIELLKDGGFYTLDLDPEAREPARARFHPLPR